jgi:hypothetical protein
MQIKIAIQVTQKRFWSHQRDTYTDPAFVIILVDRADFPASNSFKEISCFYWPVSGEWHNRPFSPARCLIKVV